VQYLYHKGAGSLTLTLEGDEHRYIFKVRRHKVGDHLHLRNLLDATLYRYTIASIDKKSLTLTLQESRELVVEAPKKLHIGWCIIDPKNVEKLLPTLNELGVSKLSFILCDRSQNNFRPDIGRLEKILLASSQQCGRSTMMDLEIVESLKEFKHRYPKSSLLNFSPNTLGGEMPIESIVVGCEGGLSVAEEKLFTPEETIGLATPMVLKSESAVCVVAAKILV